MLRFVLLSAGLFALLATFPSCTYLFTPQEQKDLPKPSWRRVQPIVTPFSPSPTPIPTQTVWSLPVTWMPPPTPAAPIDPPATATKPPEPPATPTEIPPSPVPSPTPMPTATQRPTSTPSPTWTPSPSPTPVKSREKRTEDLKLLLLDLTNKERTRLGIPALKMGSNHAAQVHAEIALENCYSGHWDLWGLKPNHRYTIAGGTGTGRENVLGSSYCISPYGFYTSVGSMETKVREGVQAWMNSPGHRKTLLDPAHTILNIGIAWDSHNVKLVQQFSSDYITFTTKPSIHDNRIVAEGTVQGATLKIEPYTTFILTYHPPSKELTSGQIARTYSLCLDKWATNFLGPLSAGQFYNSLTGTYQFRHGNCIDPYGIDPGLGPATSHEHAMRLWSTARATLPKPDETIQYPYTVAETLDNSGPGFKLQADLSAILATHGPGIYTLIIWGRPDHMSEPAALSEQAIFWQATAGQDNPYHMRRPP